ESVSLGLSESDRGQLQYRPAKSWYYTSGDPGKIIAVLNETLDQADNRFEAYEMLSESYLHLPQPDVRAAVDARQKQVLLPLGDERLLAPARLRLGQLYLRLDEPGARDMARKALVRITRADLQSFYQARMAIGRTYFEDGNWQQALAIFEQLTKEPDEADSDAGLVWFWK